MKQTSEDKKGATVVETSENKLSNDTTKSSEHDSETETEVDGRSTKDASDPGDKISNLTDCLSNMNIAPGEDEESAATDDFKNMKKRGPKGGVAVHHPMPGMANKNIPIGPHGNYVPPQQQYQLPPLMKPGARRRDDDDYPPIKFMNPGSNQMNLPYTQQGAFQPMNILDHNAMQQPMMQRPSMFNNQQNPDFTFSPQSVVTSQLTNKNTFSGCQVTMQSPVQNLQQPFPEFDNDDFLDKITADFNIPAGMGQPTTQENFIPPNMSWNNGMIKAENISSPAGFCFGSGIPSPFSDCGSNDFSGKQFETRRPSDIDSGVESAEERSPYSEPAPSPTCSTYTSPPSVDSGYARSPMNESQGMPNFEDSSETLNQEQNDNLDLALAVIHDIECEDEKKKQKNAQDLKQKPPQQQPPQQLLQQNFAVPQQFHAQQAQIYPGMMPHVSMGQPVRPLPTSAPPAQAHPVAMVIPTTTQQQTTNGPSQIILLPSNSLFVVKEQPKKKLREIRPKIPQTNSVVTGSSSITTNTGMSSQTETTMTRKGTSPNKSQAQQPPVNRLLLMARRALAGRPTEDLKKQDKDGDTYLHIAVCKIDRYMVPALLERLHREHLEYLIDQENNTRQTALYLAVFLNQPVMVAQLIAYGANVNVLAQNLSSDHTTTEVKAALHVAASHGDDYLETLKQLLKAKDISNNIVNNYGQTALHCAILAHGKVKRNSEKERINSIQTIKTLIKAGADPSAQDKKSGKTPLMYAIEQRNLDLVETILTSVEPAVVRNVVRTQAFDGSSCLRIAEGLRGRYDAQIWNRLWNSLQSAASGTMSRIPVTAEFAIAT